MKWEEFCSLLRCLSADSPLGRIVQIRAENDTERLKYFTSHQKKIRSNWRNRRARQVTQQDSAMALEQFKQMFISAAK